LNTETLESRRIHPDAADAVLAAQGDLRAFERLYRAHVGRVRALACRLMGAEDADDATQDVFVRAWQKLGTFRGESAFGTWLHRLGVRVILSRRAVRSNRQARFAEGGEALDRATARRERPDLRVDFESAIDQLPSGAREVFVLYDVEGYTHEEIAEFLGIAVGTSKSQLHRARMSLRKHLG
jgi:RNA polymerase sigma-70 factor (ECF subfamily)